MLNNSKQCLKNLTDVISLIFLIFLILIKNNLDTITLSKSLSALIPHLGKKMWGVPYISKKPRAKKEVQNKKREDHEILF